MAGRSPGLRWLAGACLANSAWALLHSNPFQKRGFTRSTGPVTPVGVTSGLHFCVPGKRLIERKPVPTQAFWAKQRVRPAALDAWTHKGGNPQRTGFVNQSCSKDLSLPHWSFYAYDVVYNTPLIDGGGNIYLSSSTGEVFKLNRFGEMLWEYKLRGGMPANPALADGVLFIYDAFGISYALDTETGEPRWIRSYDQRSCAGNPAVLVADGLFFLHGDSRNPGWGTVGTVIACDASTGEEKWRKAVNSSYYNAMPAVADGEKSLVFTDMDGGVRKFEVATGRELWSNPGFPFPLTPEEGWHGGFGGAPRSHSAMALVSNGVVYTAGNPTRRTGRVRALRLDTGEEIWRHEVDSMMGNGGALADIGGVQTLVFGTGITALHPITEGKPPFVGKLYALEATTGRELWRFQAEPMLTDVCPGSVVQVLCRRDNMPDSWSAPMIDSTGTVYAGWQGGVVYALDGRTGRLRSSFNSTEAMQSQPSAGPDGELVLVTGMHVHSFWSEP